MKKYIVAILLLSGSVWATGAEEASTSFPVLFSYVQNMLNFGQACPQEKVYLHFDNTAYFQGDNIWFSAYVVDAATQKPAASKVLYVELLSPNGVVMRQLKLKVEEGRAHGSLPLVDVSTEAARALRGAVAMPSGFYEVRAYTRTMLNFDESTVFSRVFPVYEQPEKEGDYSNPTMKKYSNPYDQQRPQTKKAEKLTVTFYPEGGNLVLGIPNRVAFKAMDANGMGVAVKGQLKTNDNEQPVLLSAVHDGMGYVDFTPTKERNTATFELDGKEYSFRLPDAEKEGYALRVNDRPTELMVGLSGMNVSDELLGVTMMCRGKVCYFDTLSTRQGRAAFAIAKEKLPTGVHQLTLFNAKGKVCAQRLVFVNNGIMAGNVLIATSAEQYEPFAQVQMQVQTMAPGGQPMPATVSLAVRDSKNLGTAHTDNVMTNMLLSSELKGYIHKPEYYFESNDAAHAKALDLLMMVQGWTRYNWSQMARVEPFVIKHFVEDGLVIDGMLLHRMQDKPIKGASVKMRLYSPDRLKTQETTVVTDNEGRFGFAVEEFNGKWDMWLIATKDEKEQDCRMRLDRAARPEVRAYTSSDTYLPDFVTLAAELQAEDTKKDPMLQEYPDSVFLLDNVDVYGRRKYVDYLTFKAYDAEEDTELHIDGGNYTYKVRDYLHEKGYNIDYARYQGVIPEGITTRDEMVSWELEQAPINNRRVLWYLHNEGEEWHKSSYVPGFDIDMEDVKSIIVYDSPVEYMNIPFVREILDVTTLESLNKSKKLQDQTVLSPGLYVIDVAMHPKGMRKSKVKGQRQTTFRGYSEVQAFYAPEYPNGPIQGDVDYRRTLYWNPALATDAQGNAMVTFYNNGYSKQFDITAEGITPQGIVMRKQ